MQSSNPPFEFDVVKKRKAMDDSCAESDDDDPQALAAFEEFELNVLPALTLVQEDEDINRRLEVLQLEQDMAHGRVTTTGGVYFAWSSCLNCMKIGATRREGPEARLKEISRHVTVPFTLVAWLPCPTPFQQEAAAHAHFKDSRINQRNGGSGAGTEFFRISAGQAKEWVRSVGGEELLQDIGVDIIPFAEQLDMSEREERVEHLQDTGMENIPFAEQLTMPEREERVEPLQDTGMENIPYAEQLDMSGTPDLSPTIHGILEESGSVVQAHDQLVSCPSDIRERSKSGKRRKLIETETYPHCPPKQHQGGNCIHGRQKSKCKECGGSSLCTHGRRKSRCKECGGSSLCTHGRRKSICKECGGSSLCTHGRVKSICKECGGSSICTHGRVKSICKECGGSSLCTHGRVKSICKECGGTAVCSHGRQKHQCKECGGSSICSHGRIKYSCKDCWALGAQGPPPAERSGGDDCGSARVGRDGSR
jgi:hypothetical protein